MFTDSLHTKLIVNLKSRQRKETSPVNKPKTCGIIRELITHTRSHITSWNYFKNKHDSVAVLKDKLLERFLLMSCLLLVCEREQDCLPHPLFADLEEAGWVTCGFFFMNYSVSVTLPKYIMTWLTSEALWIDMSVRIERDVRASCAQVINSMRAQMKEGSDQRCWWLKDKDRNVNGNKTLKMLKKDPLQARCHFFFFSKSRIN